MPSCPTPQPRGLRLRPAAAALPPGPASGPQPAGEPPPPRAGRQGRRRVAAGRAQPAGEGAAAAAAAGQVWSAEGREHLLLTEGERSAKGWLVTHDIQKALHSILLTGQLKVDMVCSRRPCSTPSRTVCGPSPQPSSRSSSAGLSFVSTVPYSCCACSGERPAPAGRQRGRRGKLRNSRPIACRAQLHAVPTSGCGWQICLGLVMVVGQE